jgi:hypothetical protein
MYIIFFIYTIPFLLFIIKINNVTTHWYAVLRDTPIKNQKIKRGVPKKRLFST